MSDEQAPAMWAIVEIMGHAQTAGRISRPADQGGLLRVDVPCMETYRTEYYGNAAIYSIKIVSEEICRAYAAQQAPVIQDYAAPVVPRELYEKARSDAERRLRMLANEVDELRRRLTAVNALPAGDDEETEIDPDHMGNTANW